MATVPIGYGDGWRRGLSNDCDVLIRGRRHPVVGTVSMDNITVEVGRGSDVEVGDTVTLIGRQGDERILAEEVAVRLGTINYEITCGLSPRVLRRPVTVSDPLTKALGGRPAWIVGGTVRDELLGRPVTDVDVAVAGEAEDAARAVARAVRGPVFPLSERFGAWRAIDRESGRTYDVSELQGATIEEDLSRRDFTVNAMARPLDGGR